MPTRMNHVSHVVRNLEKALETYEEILHVRPWAPGIIELDEQGTRLVWLPIGDNFIELIQPTKIGNRFARQLEERGEGLFHLSVFAEDYAREIALLRAKGYRLDEESFLFDKRDKDSIAHLAFLAPEQTHGAWIEIVDGSTVKY